MLDKRDGWGLHDGAVSAVQLPRNLLFRERLGFTGTPSELLPMKMGKCGFAEGAEGEMVHTLTSLSKMKPVLVECKGFQPMFDELQAKLKELRRRPQPPLRRCPSANTKSPTSSRSPSPRSRPSSSR